MRPKKKSPNKTSSHNFITIPRHITENALGKPQPADTYLLAVNFVWEKYHNS